MHPEWSIPHVQVKQKKIGVSTLNAKLAEHIDNIDSDLVREPYSQYPPESEPLFPTLLPGPGS